MDSNNYNPNPQPQNSTPDYYSQPQTGNPYYYGQPQNTTSDYNSQPQNTTPDYNSQPETPAPESETPQPTGKKPKSFTAGIWAGIGIGMLSMLCLFFLGIYTFSTVSGRYLVLGRTSNTSSLIHTIGDVDDSDTEATGADSYVSLSEVLDEDTLEMMDEIIGYVNADYFNAYTADDLQDGILHGLVDALGDQYSVYYNEEEFASFNTSVSGTYAGIGAGLANNADGNCYITKIYAGTPSEDAGLKADDIITAIDGMDALGMESSEAVTYIRGDEGTTVTLTVYRPSTAETLDIVVTREYIVLPSVNYNMLDNNIGYIQVTAFQSETDKQFEAAYEDLESQGMTSVIIDLRDNGGGYLDTCTNMLDYLLPEGTLVYTEDKYGNKSYTTSDASCKDLPMVILVNGNSASASEVFSGAIKDYGAGTLIGTTTFGKGIVQTTNQLTNGGGLKLTTYNYYTPNGNYIHGVGIDPDIELEYEFLGTEDQSYDQSLDNQLIYAQQYLLGETE